MPSSSRNSRKPAPVVQIAFAATLLAGSAAYAADQPHNFALTAFRNTAAGDALVRGKYETALTQLAVDARSVEHATVSTNRCVALTAMRELKAAHEACDEAVHDAQLEFQSSARVSTMWGGSDYRNYLAIAYSNRAVLSWLSSDATAAQADLEKAAVASPKAEFVARNLKALQSHAAVAQAVAVTKS